MSAVIDLTGKRFGRLSVTSFAHANPPRRQAYWNALCDCGERVVVHGSRLRLGHTKSCGCRVRDAGAERLFVHGEYGSAEYRTWRGMLNRCHNTREPGFANYGGRGIVVCHRWRDSFKNFLADMGRKPSTRHSIDRIDNDGNYEPDNCRWATAKEQSRNQSTNRFLTYGGETMPVAAWAERVGVKASTISRRLALGWTVDRTLTSGTGPTAGRIITFRGQGLTIAEWSRRTGISENALRERLARRWPLDVALTQRPHKGNRYVQS